MEILDVERLEETQRYLKYHLNPGDSVWYLWRKSSRSGMRRYYDVYIVVNNEIRRITYSVAVLTAYNYHRGVEALYVNGFGFSAITDVTEALSLSLFGRPDQLEYREI